MANILRLLFVLIFLLFSTSVNATDYYPATCSQANVTAAIASASNGDTIYLPACPSGAIWSSRITLNKSLDIIGNGTGSTVIKGYGFYVPSTVDNWNISHIEFQGYGSTYRSGGGDHAFLIGTYGGNVDPVEGFTIHDCLFVDIYRVFWVYSAYGVIYDNIFKDIGVVGVYAYGQWVGNEEWWRDDFDDDYGTDRFLFIEDNLFWADVEDPSHAISSRNGGRFVARYNTFRDTFANNTWNWTDCIDVHGYGYGTCRSGRIVEVYHNTFERGPDAVGYLRVMNFRGGTGVVYDNIYDESEGQTFASGWIGLAEYRAYDAGFTGISADGSLSQWCHNTRYCDVSQGGEGYPCCDQIGRGGEQASSPMYFWDNKNIGGTPRCPPVVAPGCETFIQSSRDYYLSEKPAYTPYTYPHPLRSGSEPPGDVTPPTPNWFWPDGNVLNCSTDPRLVSLQGEWSEAAVTHYCKDDGGDTCDGNTSFDAMLEATEGGVMSTSGGIAFYQTLFGEGSGIACGASYKYWVRSQDAAENESISYELSFSINPPPGPESPTGYSVTEVLGTVKNIDISGSTKTMDIQ